MSSVADHETIDVQVRAIRLEAEAVWSFELRATGGSALPPFTAGAHLDVMLPDGGERSYSLLNAPSERHRYMIGVRRAPDGRGGSIFLCDSVRVGDLLRIKAPTNGFPLVENAPHSVLIAGGIGITPLLSMLRRLQETRSSWQLFVAARSRVAAPFLEELDALVAEQAGRIVMQFDDEGGAPGLDLGGIISGQPMNVHFYCCGPAPMLEAFTAAAAARPASHVHVEYFAAAAPVAAGGFDIVLAKSGRTIRIAPDRTILETLLAEGMDLPRSCMEGVCGTCETGVLEGVPDHRDQVLSARERRSNSKMMICRSGCIGDRLVLDL